MKKKDPHTFMLRPSEADSPSSFCKACKKCNIPRPLNDFDRCLFCQQEAEAAPVTFPILLSPEYHLDVESTPCPNCRPRGYMSYGPPWEHVSYTICPACNGSGIARVTVLLNGIPLPSHLNYVLRLLPDKNNTRELDILTTKETEK